jgi:uncharacterized membrane protein YGL010W
MFSLLGLLAQLKFQLFREQSCNGAAIFILLALIFYIRLGLRPFFIMLTSVLPMCALIWFLDQTLLTTWRFYLALFIIGWIGQFIGHRIEGKRPSFFQDLQFLLIGPLWIFSSIGTGGAGKREARGS